MSLSRREITKLSRMTVGELQVEVGRAIYESLSPKLSIELEVGGSHIDEGHFPHHLHVGYPSGILNKAHAKVVFKRQFSKSKERLRHQICIVWGYCRKRNKYKNETALVNAMVAIVPLTMEGISIQGTYAVAFLLVRMGLDKFCRCDSGGLKVGSVG
jgi:hypothetical protein